MVGFVTYCVTPNSVSGVKVHGKLGLCGMNCWFLLLIMSIWRLWLPGSGPGSASARSSVITRTGTIFGLL